jgi:hypothetical protein
MTRQQYVLNTPSARGRQADRPSIKVIEQSSLGFSYFAAPLISANPVLGMRVGAN